MASQRLRARGATLITGGRPPSRSVPGRCSWTTAGRCARRWCWTRAGPAHRRRRRRRLPGVLRHGGRAGSRRRSAAPGADGRHRRPAGRLPLHVSVAAGSRAGWLVEDTYYVDEPQPGRGRRRGRASPTYLHHRGLEVRQVVREEQGVLAHPLADDGRRASPRRRCAIGYRGGLFHPATGYSFGLAVGGRARRWRRTAPRPAGAGRRGAAPGADVGGRRASAGCSTGCCSGRCRPAERWQIFARFYRLPEATIARFYALRLTAVDQAAHPGWGAAAGSADAARARRLQLPEPLRHAESCSTATWTTATLAATCCARTTTCCPPPAEVPRRAVGARRCWSRRARCSPARASSSAAGWCGWRPAGRRRRHVPAGPAGAARDDAHRIAGRRRHRGRLEPAPGRACLHRLHGLPLALNTGNWMYFWPLDLLDALELAPTRLRPSCGRGMCAALFDCHYGQALDLARAGGPAVASASCRRWCAATTRLKTGTLTRAGGRARARWRPARAPARWRRWRASGSGWAWALQMLDDLGNLRADARRRRRRYEDLRHGRPTWPWAWAAAPARRRRVRRAAARARGVLARERWRRRGAPRRARAGRPGCARRSGRAGRRERQPPATARSTELRAALGTATPTCTRWRRRSRGWRRRYG